MGAERLGVWAELLGAAKALRRAVTSHNYIALDCLVRARVLENIARSLPAPGGFRLVEGGL